MPENSSDVEQARNDHQAPGRYNWRSKLLESYRNKGDHKPKEVGLATEVTDFLNGTTSSAATKPEKGSSTPLLGRLTTQGWPSARGAPRLAEEDALPIEGPFHQSTRTKSASPVKRAKNKGLRVRFTDLAPLIIGEGGDEAELPPKDMLRARKALGQGHGKHQSDVEGGEVKTETCPNRQLPEESSHVALDIFRDSNSVSLQRTSTSSVTSEARQKAMVPQEKKGSTPNEGDSPLIASNEENEESGVLIPHSHTPKVNANATRFPTELNEGQEAPPEFHIWSPSLDDTAVKHAKDNSTCRPPLATRGYTLSDINSTTTSSLSSTPSRQSPSQTRTMAFHTDGPAVPPPRRSPQPPGGLTTFQDVVQHYDPPVNKVSKAAPLSMRAVAHAVGSDALDDFAARVQPYDSVFQRTAAGDRPDRDTDFAEWIRAATWWFLKGRGDLERAIRSRPRSADSSRNAPRTDISQAHVDLAKTWWILNEVTPEHPDLKPYGTFGLQAMAAVIRNFKAEELAESVEKHVGLLASMRALTMSMKRNHLLPPELGNDSQLTGLDTRIWVAPAPLPSYLLPLLSSHPWQASVRNGISHNSNHFSDIPIGDSVDLFCYGSMFVQMVITVHGGGGEDTRLPCILTVVRKPTHRQMDVILASQDKQVCFVIQSNMSPALSWCDVTWKAPELQLQFGLSERIEVQVQFKEHDYNVLCRLHARNHEIMRSFVAGAQEALLYEATLRDFVCLDPRRTKQFPSDAIKRCQLRLFEKKVTRLKGTGAHEVHQGYRLAVVTPPNIKTSSVVESYLSCKKPVVFSYLRGEEGTPALLLKLFDEAEYSLDTSFSVVMTFDEAAQRAEMHSLLNGTAARSSDRTIAALVLNNLSIRTRCSAGPTSSEPEIHPTGLQWEKIEIVNGSSRQTKHSHDRLALPESLRLYMTSSAGTMTDRVNLSKYSKILSGIDC